MNENGWSTFQMTVESNYGITVATLNDWPKKLAPLSQPMRSKTKSSRTVYAISFALGKFQVTAWNFPWFIGLFAPVVISRSNYFGIGFLAVI